MRCFLDRNERPPGERETPALSAGPFENQRYDGASGRAGSDKVRVMRCLSAARERERGDLDCLTINGDYLVAFLDLVSPRRCAKNTDSPRTRGNQGALEIQYISFYTKVDSRVLPSRSLCSTK